MKISVNITEDGIKKYPLHSHPHWEIMQYVSGNGFLHTAEADYPFLPGTIIVVPPGVVHGSVSDNGFKNISIGGDFSHLLVFQKPCTLMDNEMQEGKMLAETIWRNRFNNQKYVSSLCTSYIYFLLQNLKIEGKAGQIINDIVSEMIRNVENTEFDVTEQLCISGYAEDYVRALFKRYTDMTPIAFMTKIRMDQARFLLEVYGEELSIAQIAEKCGYTDPVYFSRRFKKCTSVSPQKYKAVIMNYKKSSY